MGMLPGWKSDMFTSEKKASKRAGNIEKAGGRIRHRLTVAGKHILIYKSGRAATRH